MWFALLAVRDDYWHVVGLLSTSTPHITFYRAALQLLLSPFYAINDSSVFWAMEIPLQGFFPFKTATASPTLVAAAKLIMVHSTPACRLLICLWNRTGQSGVSLSVDPRLISTMFPGQTKRTIGSWLFSYVLLANCKGTGSWLFSRVDMGDNIRGERSVCLQNMWTGYRVSMFVCMWDI